MAFVKVVEDTRAYLELRQVRGVEVTAGPDARVAQPNGDGSANRIAFVPAPSVEIAEPRLIGEHDGGGEVRRALLDTLFVFDVCFAGFDDEHPESDLHHRRACYGLWEVTAQALQRTLWGSHEWRGARWQEGRKHGRHGAELIATLAVSVPLFDAPWTTAAPVPLPGEPKPADT